MSRRKRKDINGVVEEGHKQLKVRLYPDEIERVNQLRRLENEAIEAGLDPSTVRHAWMPSRNEDGDKINFFIKNPNFKEQGNFINDVDEIIGEIILKHSNKAKRLKFELPKPVSNKALKVTLSDSHVGMNPNPNNNALFQYEYNADTYVDSLGKVFTSILKEHATHGAFDLLLLDDLGDMADGWNGYTTRGGHTLPQNMTNAEVFELCLDSKVDLVRRIIESKVSKKIVLRCVCNDNHAGDFGLIINKAIQKVINLMFSKDIVEVDILERFIEHRTYGKHCFVLTHGKDKEQMRSGLPIVLNDKAVTLINDYIDHYEIESEYIHVEKGDLHQIGYQRTKKFDYRNFMSFAPPSSWVQHNFGDCYSGYSIQVVPKETNEISHTDYFLDYTKIK